MCCKIPQYVGQTSIDQYRTDSLSCCSIVAKAAQRVLFFPFPWEILFLISPMVCKACCYRSSVWVNDSNTIGGMFQNVSFVKTCALAMLRRIAERKGGNRVSSQSDTNSHNLIKWHVMSAGMQSASKIWPQHTVTHSNRLLQKRKQNGYSFSRSFISSQKQVLKLHSV